MSGPYLGVVSSGELGELLLLALESELELDRTKSMLVPVPVTDGIIAYGFGEEYLGST